MLRMAAVVQLLLLGLLLMFVATFLMVTTLSGIRGVVSNRLSVISEMPQLFYYLKTLRSF